MKKVAIYIAGIILLIAGCVPSQVRVTSALPQPQKTTEVSIPAITKTVLPGVGPGIEFEIIAQEAPIGDFRRSLFTLALGGNVEGQELPADLPPEAAQVLQAALKENPSDTFLLIYAGSRPSGGFSVQIDSLTQEQREGQEVLVVRYHVQLPDPTTGAITATTFPYLIARMKTENPVEGVKFEETTR